jgi:outer membrane protein OmpA-like peptidoglycan-associated protein
MKAHWGVTGILAAFLFVSAGSAHAIGIGDLKKKAEKEAKKAAEKEAPKTEVPGAPAGTEAGSEAEAPAGGDGGNVSAVSTKFDFVPGDKVILMDDFTRDELGEFPSRWKAHKGNFDTVDFENERWLRLNGTEGLIAIKCDSLPEKWTLDFDCYQKEMTGPVFTVGTIPANSEAWVWYAALGNNLNDVEFWSADTRSTAKVPAGLNGRHHVSIMAAGTSLKVYVDRERMANVPEMTFKPDQRPAAIAFQIWRYNTEPMITNVRFAEGGKPKVDMMATPFVTHGIVFDSGSDKIKPESAPVLRQVSAYLKENPEVKVTITGHTDDVGETAANQTLSEKRATAVAASLSTDFGVDASRLSTAGKGESEPMAKNDSPEGKAMNRRVEFAKKG